MHERVRAEDSGGQEGTDWLGAQLGGEILQHSNLWAHATSSGALVSPLHYLRYPKVPSLFDPKMH